MSSTTTYYGFYLPALGDGALNGKPWGAHINANFTTIDTALHSISGDVTTIQGQLTTGMVPAYTSSQNGQFLGVVGGALTWATVQALPAYSSSNNGQYLGITGGVPVWSTVQSLPSYSSANNGQVLGIQSGVPTWVSQSGGGAGTITKNTSTLSFGGTLTVSHTSDTDTKRLAWSTSSDYSISTVSGTAAASSYYYTRPPSLAFDKHDPSLSDNGWVNNGGTTGWISFQFTSAQTVATYALAPLNMSGNTSRTPSAWTFDGSNDGSSWTTLDTITSQTGWSVGEIRTYTIASPGSYVYYRLNISANNGDGYLGLSQLYFNSGTPVVSFMPIVARDATSYGVAITQTDATTTTFMNRSTSAMTITGYVLL